MDSLLANYASSDEEEGQGLKSKSSPKRGGGLGSMPPPKSSLFYSLPPPKSQSAPEVKSGPKSSLFDTLPPPKSLREEQSLENSKPKSFFSLFSSIPAPKSSSSSASSSNSKRVVQFRPPAMLNTSSSGFNDKDEEDDEGDKERQRKRSKESASASFGFILPAPRYSTSLGTLGSGRRSMLETGSAASAASEGGATENVGAQSNLNSKEEYMGEKSGHQSYHYSTQGVGIESCANYGGYVAGSGIVHGNDNVNSSLNYTNPDYYNAGDGVDVGSEAVNYSYGIVEHVEYTNAGNSYVDYPNNPQYENNWSNPTPLPEVSDVINELKVPVRRGRKDVLPEIIEVKQDDLTKNRPREDQVKSTGIAFGPAYQPASSKGKPTKLHKRKHQISSLYFEMRQKETELAERRSRGYQTKAQTQGKYGW